MRQDHRRTRAIVLLVIEVVAILSVFGWQFAGWREAPWLGITYLPDADAESEEALSRGFGTLGFPSGWVLEVAAQSPAHRAGVVVYDELVSLGGIPLADTEGLARQARSVQVGDRLPLELRQSGELVEVEIVVATVSSAPSFLASLATSVLLAIVFLGFGFWVFLRSSQSEQASVFQRICHTGAGMFLLWALWEVEGHRLGGLEPVQMRAAYILLLIGFLILATALSNLILHLALIYPRRRPILDRWPQVLVWVHTATFWPAAGFIALVGVVELGRVTAFWLTTLLAFVAALALLAVALRRRKEGGWLRPFLDNPWHTQAGLALLVGGVTGVARLFPMEIGIFLAMGVVLGLIVLYGLLIFGISLLTCGVLWRSYRESGVEAKRQVSWPLWGTFIVFVVPLALGAVTAVAGDLGWLHGFESPVAVNVFLILFKLVYVLIPASFAAGLLKVRLLEIDLLIGRTVVYGGLGLFVAGGWLVLAELGRALAAPTVGSQTLAVGAAALAIGLAVPVRGALGRFVDRRFFRVTRDPATVRERLAEAASGSGDLPAFLDQVATEVQQALGSSHVAVFVAEGEMAPKLRAKVGLSDELVDRLELTGLGDGPQVMPLAARDKSTFPELRQLDARLLARARLAGRTVGAVTVGQRISRRPYLRSDELFLAAVADQLALAIRRVEQRGESAEMAQARAIQQALVPRETPQIDGLEVAARWEPAREIGGDAYDVLRFDDHRIGVAIGDVAGKGLPAALLMSGLQAALKAVAGPEADPALVAQQVRRVVCQNLTGGRFVTFFYALIDRRRRRLRYANLGHCQPLLVRQDGTAELLSEGAGVMSRLMADTPIQGGERPLHDGDRLLLFTDGVSEARDGAGEDFGEARVADWLRQHRGLSADDLVSQLALEVEEYAEGQLNDDLTLVAVAVQPTDTDPLDDGPDPS